jgi:hypothetical protein
MTTAKLGCYEIEQKDQALRIRKLEKEIEELKRPEGELKNAMIDFMVISTRSTKRGVIEIYPKFIIQKKHRSNDSRW